MYLFISDTIVMAGDSSAQILLCHVSKLHTEAMICPASGISAVAASASSHPQHNEVISWTLLLTLLLENVLQVTLLPDLEFSYIFIIDYNVGCCVDTIIVMFINELLFL